MKRLLTRGMYLNQIGNKYYTRYTGVTSINEEAPFANDIPWGDSLVGRLINSIIRKAKITFNKRRISGLLKGLKSLFDEMLEMGKLGTAEIDILYMKISIYLGLLAEQVNDEDEEIDIIIDTVRDIIQLVTDYNFDGKEDLLKALNSFLDYLKGLKEGKKEEVKEEEKSEKDTFTPALELLKSVVELSKLIPSSTPTAKPTKSPLKVEVGKEYLYNDKVVKAVDLEHPRTAGDDKKWLTTDDGRNQKEDIKPKVYVIWRDPQSKTYKPNAPGQSVDSSKLKPISKPPDIDTSVKKVQVESFLFESAEGDNAWNKITKSYNTIGLSKMISRIQELIKRSENKDSNEYKYVQLIGKQVVLNRLTVGKEIPYTELIKEAEVVPTSYNDIPKAISLVSRYILPLRENVNKIEDVNVQKVLSDFIKSFDSLIQLHQNAEKKEEPKKEVEEVKKESILKYTGFKAILEKNQYHQQIREKYDELITEDVTKYFIITEEKRAEFEAIKASVQGEEEALVFTTFDPIIEIVRLFHRAWRIHTPGVIPSGRTGGKVSNSVFREYEDLGSGGGTPDTPGSGPYRNIELYDNWYEGVQDILSDTKYRPIFSENALFKFKSVETGKEGDPIKAGGKILLRFINNLISDSKMYKEGAMNKFIQEYFQYSPSAKTKETYVGFESDKDRNKKTSESIKVTEVEFRSISTIKSIVEKDLYKFMKSVDAIENLAFKIDVDSEKTKTSYYGTFKATENDFPLLVFSTGGFSYKLDKVTGLMTTTPGTPYIGSLPKTGGSFKEGLTSKVKYISFKDDINDGVEKEADFKISKIFILCDKNTGEPYLEFKDNYINKNVITSQKIEKSKRILKK
jgi:hypothetical protein